MSEAVTAYQENFNGVKCNESHAELFAAAYRYWRKLEYTATEAKERAERDAMDGKRRYASSEFTGYNPEFAAYGEKHLRWIEKPAHCGLRRVGYADEIARDISHNGWYTDDDGIMGETLRGIVYQLPGRNGSPVYAYGYDDPNNPGACLLSFDVITGERSDYDYPFSDLQDARDAARAADHVAKRAAEEAREYDRVFQARQRYEEKAEELSEVRKEAIPLIREVRKLRRIEFGETFPASESALRDEIEELLERRETLMCERESIKDEYGMHDGWNDY